MAKGVRFVLDVSLEDAESSAESVEVGCELRLCNAQDADFLPQRFFPILLLSHAAYTIPGTSIPCSLVPWHLRRENRLQCLPPVGWNGG
eukprot:4954620-Prymnesium_polylepis.1